MEKYEVLEIEVITFESEDVIVTSGNNPNSIPGNIGLPPVGA